MDLGRREAGHGSIRRALEAHLEAGQPGRLHVAHVDVLDPGARRTGTAEVDHRVDGPAVTLEPGQHGPVRLVAHPAPDAVPLGLALTAARETHALHPAGRPDLDRDLTHSVLPGQWITPGRYDAASGSPATTSSTRRTMEATWSRAAP